MKVIKNKTILKADAKNRICGGELRDDFVSRFHEASVEIPLREQWIFKNPEALDLVRRGLEESAQGKVERRGSFQRYSQD